MYHLNFNAIEEFLDYLPDDEREIVEFLRELILDCIPDGQERLTQSTPYYYRHAQVCYIRSASVPRGNRPQYGVELGFCFGNQLTNSDYYLERGRRKQVYTKTFADTNEIDSDRIKALIFEAVEVDQENFERKLKCK